MASISFDLHTHTTYSHGKGSIEDNALYAEKHGLSMLGIADHGPGHLTYGIKISDIAKMRADVNRAMRDHPGLVIKLGVEANIINRSGQLDISKKKQGLFDYVIAGYHYGVTGEQPARSMIVHAGAVWYSLTGSATRSVISRNTDLLLAALSENNIKVLTHPGDKAPIDVAAVARACSECGTLLEINDHHAMLDEAGIREAMKYDVDFVLSSDAHVPKNVGIVDDALEAAKRAGLPAERIVNLRR